MNLRQRCQAVFQAGYKVGEQLRTRMEEKSLEYQLHVQSQLKQDGREVELCAAADEKFFDQVVLVLVAVAPMELHCQAPDCIILDLI